MRGLDDTDWAILGLLLILSDTSKSTLDTSFGGLRDVSMVKHRRACSRTCVRQYETGLRVRVSSGCLFGIQILLHTLLSFGRDKPLE